MNRAYRPNVAAIYQTDLERHLFAPAARRNGRARARPGLPSLSRWIRDWLLSGWSRWKAMAEA